MRQIGFGGRARRPRGATASARTASTATRASRVPCSTRLVIGLEARRRARRRRRRAGAARRTPPGRRRAVGGCRPPPVRAARGADRAGCARRHAAAMRASSSRACSSSRPTSSASADARSTSAAWRGLGRGGVAAGGAERLAPGAEDVDRRRQAGLDHLALAGEAGDRLARLVGAGVELAALFLVARPLVAAERLAAGQTIELLAEARDVQLVLQHGLVLAMALAVEPGETLGGRLRSTVPARRSRPAASRAPCACRSGRPPARALRAGSRECRGCPRRCRP